MSTYSTESNKNTLNINSKILSTIELYCMENDKIDIEPKIIFDLYTALTEIKNNMIRDIKKYSSKYEKLNKDYINHNKYLKEFNINIDNLTISYEQMKKTLNLIDELLNNDYIVHDKLLISSIVTLINNLKSSFDTFINIFIETRTHFKKFQNDNSEFRGYNRMNRLFNTEINDDNINKINNIVKRMKKDLYLDTLYNNGINELTRVKNKYEFKFTSINYIYTNKLTNMIYEYIYKFKNTFRYKLFIMKLLNLKFYLSRVETFKRYPDYDESGNKLTLEEMKENEFIYLNTYQGMPAIQNTFKDGSTFTEIRKTLLNFLNVADFIDNNINDNMVKIDTFNKRFDEVKEHLKDIFKQINKVTTVKEGRILNRQNKRYINNMINELNKVYKVYINNDDLFVFYDYNIDMYDLKEHHTKEENEEYIEMCKDMERDEETLINDLIESN